jgi:hypothetical protein
MKNTKEVLINEIKKALAEQAMLNFGDGGEYIGYKTGKAYEKDKESEENFQEFSGMLPQPRTRVPDIDSYNPVYSFLMGHPGDAVSMSLREIMEKTEVGDPASAAQAVADYLIDRAKIK